MHTAPDSAAAGLEPGRPDVLEGHDGSDATRPALFGRPVLKVWALTGVLAVLAVAVYTQAVREIVPLETPIDVPWPVIALLFGVGELLDVQVHFRRETHSYVARLTSRIDPITSVDARERRTQRLGNRGGRCSI